jgi:hypothetical protein
VAKKRTTPVAASGPAWIVCPGYTLDVRLSGTDFTFQLIVQNNNYTLDQTATTGLIQRTLRVIADRWPARDWEFQADGNGTITDVR